LVVLSKIIQPVKFEKIGLAALSALIGFLAIPFEAQAGGVSAITAGYRTTCALTTTGGVKCWGYNEAGQLGDNSTTDRWTPVSVQGLVSGVSAIAAGGHHACALTTAGGVKCWGYNGRGQLGDNSNTNRWTAVSVQGLGSGVSAIAAGYWHACALTTAGGVKCWG